uniref:Uncharacterized protein n=1 Tax=Zea mays TaxID=4577 RepID=A0A804PXZ7_MAIZE
MAPLQLPSLSLSLLRGGSATEGRRSVYTHRQRALEWVECGEEGDDGAIATERGDRSQVKFDGEFASPPWHCPLHLLGTGGIPWSLKLGDSGQIPEESRDLTLCTGGQAHEIPGMGGAQSPLCVWEHRDDARHL